VGGCEALPQGIVEPSLKYHPLRSEDCVNHQGCSTAAWRFHVSLFYYGQPLAWRRPQAGKKPNRI